MVLTVALVGLLGLGWSAAGWYPEIYAPDCPEPECLSRARTTIRLHWVGVLLLSLAAVGGVLGLVRSRTSAPVAGPAGLTPTWHGAVVGIVVLVLATGALLPTVRLGLLSPPLGVALVHLEWVLLMLLLDRMHRAARPATSPRRRLVQSMLVSGLVVALEVLLPLASPFPALSGGMLQLALVQAGTAFALTTVGSATDPADHGEGRAERRVAAAAVVLLAVVVTSIAVVGLGIGPESIGHLGTDLLGLTRPW